MLFQEPVTALRVERSSDDYGNPSTNRPAHFLVAPLAGMESLVQERNQRIAAPQRRLDDFSPLLAWLNVIVGHKGIDAAQLCGLLERQTAIEEQQLRRLEYAVQTNRQVYEGVYPARPPNGPVPEFISELVKRYSPPPTRYDEEPF